MPGDSAQVVKDMYVAFHGGDIPRALSYFDENVVVDATARVDGGIGLGRDELSAIIGQWLGAFDEWREDVEQVLGSGDRVCVVAVQRGRGRDSGIETETRYGVLYSVRDGAITRMTLHRDPAEALRALGT